MDPKTPSGNTDPWAWKMVLQYLHNFWPASLESWRGSPSVVRHGVQRQSCFSAAQDTFLKAHVGEGHVAVSHLSRSQMCSWSRVGTACWPTLFFVVLFSRLDVVIFSKLITNYNVRGHLHIKLPMHTTFTRHPEEK